MNLPGLHDDIEEFNQYSMESGVNYFGVNDLSGGSYIYYESGEGVFTRLIDSYQTLDGKSLSQLRLLSDTAIAGRRGVLPRGLHRRHDRHVLGQRFGARADPAMAFGAIHADVGTARRNA